MQSKSQAEQHLFSQDGTALPAARCRPGRSCGRGLAIAAALLALGPLLPGCQGKPSATPPGGPSPAVTVLRVACPDDVPATVVARYGAGWASAAGVRLEVVRYDPQAGPGAGPAADAWVIAPAQLARWAAAGDLLPVPAEYLANGNAYAWYTMLPLYQDKLLVWNGAVTALPLLGDGLLCFYRDDLLQDPAHREAYRKQHGRDLAPPETWDDFAAIAAYFHDQKRPGLDRPCAALPPLPASDDDLDRQFFTPAASVVRRAVGGDQAKPPAAELFSFHYDFETGQPRVAGPGFVHTLELLQTLQKYRPAGTVAAPPASFASGEAVLCLAGPEWIGRFQESSAIRGRFGLCRPPGSTVVYDYQGGEARTLPRGHNYVPYLGASGWLMVVPRASPQPQMAFSLAAALSDPRTGRDIVIEPAWGGGVYRREHLDARMGWQALGLKPQQTEAFVSSMRQMVAHANVLNPVLRLRTPDERTHQEALLQEVRAALTGKKSAEQALADAAERWRALDQAKGTRQHLADYRLSLGLRP